MSANSDDLFEFCDDDDILSFDSEEHSESDASDFVNILVVDDEPEVHKVTNLALSNHTYKGFKFRLHDALSACEAKGKYEHVESKLVVALLDVVMESELAGLYLAKWIKELDSRVMVVIRSGQIGVNDTASIEQVQKEFGADFVLQKSTLTTQILLDTVNQCVDRYYDQA